MAKKLKFKPTPAGILFLCAIAVLLIAIIILTVVGVTRCKKNDNRSAEPVSSELPSESLEPITSVEPEETPESSLPATSLEPIETPDPSSTDDPNVTPGSVVTGGPSAIVITTPGSGTETASASASPTAVKYYTSPTSSMKNHAQKGYISSDKVNMRKEPNVKSTLVKEKLARNTAVTLYVEQEGWWFLKCGDKYGYIKKDFITKGSAPATPASGEAVGRITASTIALRKSASEKSECIREYYAGEVVSISYYVKDSDGKKWYYVKTPDGKKGYMYANYVKVTSGKVGEKN